MGQNELELTQRKNEWFHSLTIPQGMWGIIRVDGRSFSKLTERMGYEKPFDTTFSSFMQQTAVDLLTNLNGVYGYTQSDEISIVLPPDYDLFNRSVEKLVSSSAAVASVSFSHYASVFDSYFDSRIWIGASLGDVLDYMQWRQDDATRNALNGWCYWTLRNQDDFTPRQATSALRTANVADKNELLFKHGINFNDVPTWQRRGVGFWWVDYEKPGLNPITNETVTATRRNIHANLNLPKKDYYRALITDVISGMYISDDNYDERES